MCKTIRKKCKKRYTRSRLPERVHHKTPSVNWPYGILKAFKELNIALLICARTNQKSGFPNEPNKYEAVTATIVKGIQILFPSQLFILKSYFVIKILGLAGDKSLLFGMKK